jgi:hypothetical protein
MPPPLYQGNCGYTQLSTAGTYTLNGGNPGGVEPGYFGVFYGFAAVGAFGTAGAVLAAYDVQTVVTGTGTNTNTNTLMSGTTTAQGQVLAAGPGELGVRYRGTLLVVMSGTAETVNALWD